MTPSRRKTLLIFSQTFIPDPASVGQYMADVAFEMVRRGHRVKVFASGWGYEDPSLRYPAREVTRGVEIRRFAFGSFGKKSMLRRIVGTAVFQIQCLIAGLFTPNVDGIFFSTSPPLVGAVATALHHLRRVPIAYWAMDLNPDQLIAMKKIRPDGFVARVLDSINRTNLRNASLVVALDRFMAGRLGRRAKLAGKLLVMPPWPQEDQLTTVERGEENPFRIRHNLRGKFVIMYSGNHSPANPLTTLLQSAVQLKDEPDLLFLFVGGGSGKKEVEQVIREHQLRNALSLPYQLQAELKYSLSAADVHVVSLGEEMVGIVHPSKIYGAMAVARPILGFGPRPSHLSDLLEGGEFGVYFAHGDVEGTCRAILALKQMPAGQLRDMGERARTILRRKLSQRMLCDRFCDRLEEAIFGKVRAITDG